MVGLTDRVLELATLCLGSPEGPLVGHACALIGQVVQPPEDANALDALGGRALIEEVLLQAKRRGAELAVLLETGQLLWRHDAAFAALAFARAFPRLRPWHVWRILVTAFGPLSFSSGDVGVRVAVWWSERRNYSRGVIVAFSRQNADGEQSANQHGLHTIR